MYCSEVAERESFHKKCVAIRLIFSKKKRKKKSQREVSTDFVFRVNYFVRRAASIPWSQRVRSKLERRWRSREHEVRSSIQPRPFHVPAAIFATVWSNAIWGRCWEARVGLKGAWRRVTRQRSYSVKFRCAARGDWVVVLRRRSTTLGWSLGYDENSPRNLEHPQPYICTRINLEYKYTDRTEKVLNIYWSQRSFAVPILLHTIQ
jgi:hypothetical protein